MILDYEVLATLGYGARSTIFAVKDRNGQVYALKRVVRESDEDQRFLDQAQLEHQIASSLDHRALRRSYKLMRQRRFMRTTEVLVLMEFVDGQSLELHKPASYLELCHLCSQIAEGLIAMHAAGYIHSDIKPKNILVTDDRAVKIIDFGQSCRTGTVKQRIQGTPDYIAPEQVRRRKLTPRTDVFNLGASIYWLTTGKFVPTMIPRNGRRRVQQKADPPPPAPAELNQDVPPALSALVMDCIRPAPTDRPKSMSMVHDRLELAARQLRRQQAADDEGAERRAG